MDTSDIGAASVDEVTVTETASNAAMPANSTQPDGTVDFNWLTLLSYKLGMSPNHEVPEVFFSINQSPLSVEERDFLEELSVYAKGVVENLDSDPKYSAPMDLRLHASRDMMTVYGCIIPPIGAGSSLSAEQLYAIVSESSYSYGLVENVLETILSSKAYLKIFVIARGTPKQDGKDGEIIDLFSGNRKLI